MHIGKKIVDDIQQTLVADYGLNLTAEEYEIFTNSFAETHEKYSHSAYKSRQCTSFGLMKKILQHDRKEQILLFVSDLAGSWNRKFRNSSRGTETTLFMPFTPSSSACIC